MRALVSCALLAVVLLVSGCLSPASTAPGAPPTGTDGSVGPGRMSEGPIESVGAPWNQTGNVTLGWLVGAGGDTWLGDQTVGITSHEVCPRAMFIVPRSAKAIEVTWDAPTVQADRPGVGYYTLVVSSPQAIYFIEPQLPIDQRYEMEPAPGVWEVKVQARGASANLLWTVNVAMEGEGLLEPPLQFFHDGDCIQ
jgi:hypothetical protein